MANSLQVSDTEHRTKASFKQFCEKGLFYVICKVQSLPDVRNVRNGYELSLCVKGKCVHKIYVMVYMRVKCVICNYNI